MRYVWRVVYDGPYSNIEKRRLHDEEPQESYEYGSFGAARKVLLRHLRERRDDLEVAVKRVRNMAAPDVETSEL